MAEYACTKKRLYYAACILVARAMAGALISLTTDPASEREEGREERHPLLRCRDQREACPEPVRRPS